MIRVMSWNVRSLKDSRADVVSVIRSVSPDVVCLQESPRMASRWRAARLARDCGLKVATSGPPVGALTILAAPQVRVVAAMRTPLAWRPGRHRRGLARVVVEVDGRRLQVGTFHLGLAAEEREQHARRLISLARDNGLPIVLAGDVNEVAGATAWHAVSTVLPDAWAAAGEGDGRTFSTDRPRRRIDAVFVDRRLTVTSCEVIATDAVARASDHRPVLAEVQLPGVSD